MRNRKSFDESSSGVYRACRGGRGVRVSRSALCQVLSSLAALAGLTVWGTSTAAANVSTVGLSGWQVQSSAQAPQPGTAISQPGFRARSWLHVHPDDAGAPA